MLPMAGGMNKRGGYGTMADRLAQTRGEVPVTPAVPSAPPIKHCWVTDRHGRLPALLLEWRKVASGEWQGRVVRPVLDDRGWAVVEEWLPAGLLDPGS